MNRQLEGKVAVVTGGTKGIGGACTRLFAERGAKVGFTSRNEDEGYELERQLASEGFDVLYVQCDVTKADQIEKVFEVAIAKYARLDVLINNAATHVSKFLHEYSEQDFELLIDTNLKNYFLHAKYAVPHLKKTKGSIVNISSSTGKVGQYAGSLYSATKGGILSFTKSAALDYARIPIRVNAVLPAYVDTPLLRDWINQQEQPEKTERSLGSEHALGKISRAEEIAAVAAFLASDDATAITGAIIDADGGATLGYSPAVIDYQ